MKNVKLINMKNSEETERDIYIAINPRAISIFAAVEVDGVRYEGNLSIKSSDQIVLSQYSKKAELIENDHEIVKYRVPLWGKSEDPLWPDFRAVIYADIGRNDRANPKLSEIYLIENEEELKKYIDDLIYEEENPWWDREEG